MFLQHITSKLLAVQVHLLSLFCSESWGPRQDVAGIENIWINYITRFYWQFDYVTQLTHFKLILVL